MLGNRRGRSISLCQSCETHHKLLMKGLRGVSFDLEIMGKEGTLGLIWLLLPIKLTITKICIVSEATEDLYKGIALSSVHSSYIRVLLVRYTLYTAVIYKASNPLNAKELEPSLLYAAESFLRSPNRTSARHLPDFGRGKITNA